MPSVRERLTLYKDRAKKHLFFMLLCVGVLWAVYFVNLALPASWGDLRYKWHIRPRTFSGIFCIPVAPFLHLNLWHLSANTLPLVALGWILSLSGWGLFLRVCVFTALTSGLGTWGLGQASIIHEGASGIMMGMLGFLLARGWFGRKLFWAVTALGVGLFYIVELLSLLRNEEGLSWASHFWGFAGGVALAWWMYGRRAPVLLVPAAIPTHARISNRARR
ncbi:MAG TPA: rhomboid family intramembrane serine protease [Verrucomicrobiales bacterium]|nr:rhomboid family intramembrane serine protease [Verrucomicrobiales bacterium]